jgi:16S rRNA G966 N2-methylase RsmD
MSKIYKHKLFPKPQSNSYDELQIDMESISYITTPRYAKQICDIICDTMKSIDMDVSESTILDCTSGVGGDIISFGNVFKHVIAYELDEKRFGMMSNNVNVYNLSNVTTINDNCFDSMYNVNFADVVYIDPPWGGKNYKNKENLILSMTDSNGVDYRMCDIVNNIFASNMNVSVIVMKLPNNYNLKNLYMNTKDIITSMTLYELRKMKVIVILK